MWRKFIFILFIWGKKLKFDNRHNIMYNANVAKGNKIQTKNFGGIYYERK